MAQITDRRLLALVEECDSIELNDHLASGEDLSLQEMGFSSELEWLKEEATYTLSTFTEKGFQLHHEVLEAQQIDRETEGGKVTPLVIEDLKTFKIKNKYSTVRVKFALDLLAEMKRLKKLVKALEKMSREAVA